MRPAVTLYEFMPYGAPELLESRQRHMCQALAITSASALALYAVAAGLASLVSVTPSQPHRTTVAPRTFVIPPAPTLSSPAPAAPRARASRAPSPAAPPVPVPDALAPPMEAPAAPVTDASGTAPPGPIASSDVGTAPPGEEVLPSPETFVYVEELPAVVKQVKPIYPRLAQDASVEGLVMVKVLVGKDGRVLDTRLVERFQVPMLNEAALTAARQWVFTPGLANGRPVACWTQIPFRFRLH